MAPLPLERVAVKRFWFEHCKIDYMCGIKVKQGCNELKRYASIFTCITTCSTHLEIANDWSTESFLMAYHQFLTLTKSVTIVQLSDNGSNFRGAASELKRNLEHLNKKQVIGNLAVIGVEFNFNPPLFSHQVGNFEAIIKPVRKAMTSLNDDQKLRTLTDEGRKTLFCEIQMILNRQPLTKADPYPNNFRALCPQSILIGKHFLTDVFIPSDDLRASYHFSQAYVEEFLRQFMAEYLIFRRIRRPSDKTRKKFKYNFVHLSYIGCIR